MKTFSNLQIGDTVYRTSEKGPITQLTVENIEKYIGRNPFTSEYNAPIILFSFSNGADVRVYEEIFNGEKKIGAKHCSSIRSFDERIYTTEEEAKNVIQQYFSKRRESIQEQIDDLQKAVKRLDEREKFALTLI